MKTGTFTLGNIVVFAIIMAGILFYATTVGAGELNKGEYAGTHTTMIKSVTDNHDGYTYVQIKSPLHISDSCDRFEKNFRIAQNGALAKDIHKTIGTAMQKNHEVTLYFVKLSLDQATSCSTPNKLRIPLIIAVK